MRTLYPFQIIEAGVTGHRVERHAEDGYAYTSTQIDWENCRKCGGEWREVQTLAVTDAAGATRAIGSVRACRACDAQSWMFVSHMPSVVHENAMRARSVV